MYKKKKIIGIILARSKSKRLKDKNILNIKGKPLFYWTVQAAKKSKYIDDIIISTDDKRIINYTKKLSYLKTLNRPKGLRGDKVKSEQVVSNLISKKDFLSDIIIVLQPTSPLRKSFDIDNSIKKMVNKNEHFIISACYRKKNYKNMIEVKKGFFNKFKKKKSGYALNGAIYGATTKYFKRTRSFFTRKTIIFTMPPSRSIDIDTIEDFNLAKKKFKN